MVEGPDGAGKTTLVKHLASELKGPTMYLHHDEYKGMSGRDLFNTFARSYLKVLDGTNMVLDRSHISEKLYAQAMSRKDRLASPSLDQHRTLDRLLFTLDAIIVKCLPSLQSCQTAMKERDQLPSMAQHTKVWHLYQQYKLPPTAVTLGFDQSMYKKVKAVLDFRLARPTNYPGSGPYRQGHQVLLLGDTPNPRQTLGFPFTQYGGCTAWLNNQLNLFGVNEWDLAWLNTTDALNNKLNPAWVLNTKPRLIIAMGDKAQQWAKDHGFGYVETPHPQWERRFQYHKKSLTAHVAAHALGLCDTETNQRQCLEVVNRVEGFM